MFAEAFEKEAKLAQATSTAQKIAFPLIPEGNEDFLVASVNLAIPGSSFHPVSKPRTPNQNASGSIVEEAVSL